MRQAGTTSSAVGLGYGEVASSLLLIFPLFLAYELALLVVPAGNGVDFVSNLVFDAVGRDAQLFLTLHLVLGALFLVLLLVLWRRNLLVLERVTSMLLESAIYALTLGSFIVFIMDRLMGGLSLVLEPSTLLVPGAGIENALVVSLGAGVHEELVFRLGIMGVGGVLLCTVGVRRWAAILLAAFISSGLFALAHHVGAAGEAFELSIFVYRALAGLAFAAVFYFRTLAHAVYTHFLYDLYVLGIA